MSSGSMPVSPRPRASARSPERHAANVASIKRTAGLFALAPGLGVWVLCKFVSAVLLLRHHVTAGVVVYLAPDPWFLAQYLFPGASGFGPVITRFVTSRKEVWLTIDDGPDPDTTPHVLDLLDRYGANATFFLVGQNVERHPELVREIVRCGHQVANHTASHPHRRFWCAGPRRNGREIDICAAALRAAQVEPAPYFRPPVGIKNVFLFRELARRQLDCVAWSARGFDRICTADTALARITRTLRPGAIVLLHEAQNERGSVRVIERVLQHLQQQGYAAVIPDRSTLR